MKRIYHFLLAMGMVIAFALIPHLSLWSQTPDTVTPTAASPSAVAASGTYETVACNTLMADPDGDGPVATADLFPGTATEGKDYECGYLTVPELHSQPDGNTIQVGIAILKSFDPNPKEPLIMFQGGPGGSSLDLFPALFADPENEQAQQLRANRDLIAFEKRGNRFSKPWLACPEFTNADESQVTDRAGELALVQACRDRLTQEGVNIAAFNSVESAHDVAVLAKALGYDQLNLYGVSYGTELVQNVMRQHPDILRSVIIDGIVPPNPSIDAQYAVILDRLITQVDTACKADVDCHAAYPDVKGTFEETFERLNQAPAKIPLFNFTKSSIDEQTFTGMDLAETLFHLSYSSGAPFVMPALIYQVHEGKYSLLAQNLYINSIFSLVPSDSADGLYFSVKCSEDMAYAGPLETGGVSPAAMTWGQKSYQDMVEYCQVWNVPAVDPSARELVKSDIPALLWNGNFDPITPPPFGEIVARGLSKSTFVVFTANGHGAIGTPCSTGIMSAFLADPTQTPDTTCAKEQPVQFITEKNTLMAPGTAWLTTSIVNLQIGSIVQRLFLLGLLILFPVVWLCLWLAARLRRKEPRPTPAPAGETWAPWLGVLLAGLSTAWIVFQLFEIGFTAITGGHGQYGYTRIFVGVDRSLAWIYVIPILIAITSGGMAILAILSWKHHYWGKVRRVFYSLTAGVAIAYTLFLAQAGQLTVFF
jgi:pimeloyl-ACP methyl ester carboxylesterase